MIKPLCALFVFTSFASAATAEKIVTIKTLLTELPAEDRAAFVGGLTLSGGQIVSASSKPLEKLGGDRQTAILDSLAPKKGAKAPSGKRAPLARVSDLLKGVPKAAADEFMGSLVFVNGKVAGASVGTLESSVSPARFKEILDSFAPPGTKAPRGQKGLCGNGWCKDSLCLARGPERLHCEDTPKEICWSSCR